MKAKSCFIFALALIMLLSFSFPVMAQRYMENLDRGVVAVKVTNGVFVSWRVLGTEWSGVGYNVYRGTTKLNSSPITGATNYSDASGTTSSTYSVSAVVNGTEQARSPAVSVWGTNYLTVSLQRPSGGTTPDGVAYTYNANDCSVGDLNGDGKYEIVLKWDPSNSKDNSQSGYTGNVFLDAYTMGGTRMWRIDLAETSAPGRITRSSWCTTSTATARPKSHAKRRTRPRTARVPSSEAPRPITGIRAATSYRVRNS